MNQTPMRVDYKILFVEYEKKDRIFIENLFKKNGLKISLASNYEKAAEEVGKGIYHIVITSVLPSDVKCVQLLNNLRHYTNDIEVVVVLEQSLIEESLALLTKNPYYHIIFKPFNDGVFLLNAIRKIIRQLNQKIVNEDIKSGLVSKNSALINKDIALQNIMHQQRQLQEMTSSLRYPMDTQMLFKGIATNISRFFSCIIFEYDPYLKKLRCLYQVKKFCDYEEIEDKAITFIKILDEDIRIIIDNFDKEMRYRTQITKLFGINNFKSFPIATGFSVYGLAIIYDYEHCDEHDNLFNGLTMFMLKAAECIESSILHSKISFGMEEDSLTNLMSYKGFIVGLEHYLHRAQRHEESVALLILDIDYFKRYSERFGYIRGDRVIQIIAELIKSTIRRSDIAARLDEDKFIIMLGKTDDTGTSIATNKLQAAIESYSFPDGHTQPHGKFTISIGHAVFPADGESPQLLIKTARKRLQDYKEKKGIREINE